MKTRLWKALAPIFACCSILGLGSGVIAHADENTLFYPFGTMYLYQQPTYSGHGYVTYERNGTYASTCFHSQAQDGKSHYSVVSVVVVNNESNNIHNEGLVSPNNAIWTGGYLGSLTDTLHHAVMVYSGENTYSGYYDDWDIYT